MVLAGILGIPLSLWIPVVVIDGLEWPIGAELLAILAILAGVSVPLLVLQEFRRNLFRRENADERERQRRDDAYRLSYRILQLGLLLVPLGLVLFRDQVASLVSYDWFLIYWPFMFYSLFLPYMVFAWREPDAAD